MMRVVNLLDEIRHRQLQLMQPEPPGFVRRREFEPRAETEQDVRDLRDREPARFQKRRRIRRPLFLVQRMIDSMRCMPPS